MRTKFTRVALGAATAVAFVGLFASTANAAAGELTVTPSTGTSSTVFTALPPTGSKCPGDAVAGYRISSFVTPTSNNPATLTYNADGPIGTSTYPLFDPNQTPFVGQNPGLGGGEVAPIPSFSWTTFAGSNLLPAGNYFIGIACTLGTPSGIANTTTFWSTTVTLGADGATYAVVSTPPDIPEVPLNVLLPVSAAAILGAGFLVARKRQSHVSV